MAMHSVGTAQSRHAVALLTVEDEDLADRYAARLLITDSTQQAVETLARRIHGAGLRAEFPFVPTRASDLPVEPKALRERCSSLLDAAAGGSLLISDVEELAPIVQDALLEVLAGLEVTRRPASAVRLISGTTVSLFDRVTAGTFSERLFYQLNVLHLMQGERSNSGATPNRRR